MVQASPPKPPASLSPVRTDRPFLREEEAQDGKVLRELRPQLKLVAEHIQCRRPPHPQEQRSRHVPRDVHDGGRKLLQLRLDPRGLVRQVGLDLTDVVL